MKKENKGFTLKTGALFLLVFVCVISLSTSAIAQTPLKAVLLVGPINGDYDPQTTEYKQDMNLAAAELEANGVVVYKFYTPDNDWEQIKAAADGAQFFFYSGHGILWPHGIVGGLCLKNLNVTPDKIRSEINLAPNAIVMLSHVCYAAGPSANDDGPISSEEAQNRVSLYSDPFLDIGAMGYYASNIKFSDGRIWYTPLQTYVSCLFQGMTLGEAYEDYFNFNRQLDPGAVVEHHIYPNNSEMVMRLGRSILDGESAYSSVFVGLPGRTLESLFQTDIVEDTTILESNGCTAAFIIGRSSYVFDNTSIPMDAVSCIKNNRTYVPVRYLANALGVADSGITWDSATQIVTLNKGSDTVRLIMGSKTLDKNGGATTMDVVPSITDGRMMLPARWVAEAFGATVGWDGTTQAVLITYL